MVREELSQKSLIQLRELAKDAGLKSFTACRKPELIDRLLAQASPSKTAAAEPKAPAKRGRKPKDSGQDNTATETQISKPAVVKQPAAASFPINESSVIVGSPPIRPAYPRPAASEQTGSATPRAPYYKRNDESAYRQGAPYRDAPQKSYASRDNAGGSYREAAPRSYAPRDNFATPPLRTAQVPRPRYGTQSGTDERERNYENMPSLSDVLASGNCFDCQGVLEIVDSYGFLRVENYYAGPKDVYVAPAQIFRFRMKTGDWVTGKGYYKNSTDKFPALVQIDQVNGELPVDNDRRVIFEQLTPIFPEERYTLEVSGRNNVLATRLIDLISPIGKGQRAMVVAQPKAGKTTLLKQIANGISENNPDVHLIVLLIDERPEEVTDIKRSVRGEVIYSTFDELPEHHTRTAEMVQERAMRLVEKGKDVVILLDSLTRLTRAYNLTIPPTGRTLSGGMDPGALHKPKRFFGAARNIEHGGSLTVIATALVETGSRMDDIVYEEFKGTGNMEIHLDRKLAERRVFPAIDIYKSGTRRDDLLLSQNELEGVRMIRRVLAGGAPTEVTEQLITMMNKTETNEEFLIKLRDWVRIFEKQGYTSSGSQNRYGQ